MDAFCLSGSGENLQKRAERERLRRLTVASARLKGARLRSRLYHSAREENDLQERRKLCLAAHHLVHISANCGARRRALRTPARHPRLESRFPRSWFDAAAPPERACA